MTLSITKPATTKSATTASSWNQVTMKERQIEFGESTPEFVELFYMHLKDGDVDEAVRQMHKDELSNRIERLYEFESKYFPQEEIICREYLTKLLIPSMIMYYMKRERENDQ